MWLTPTVHKSKQHIKGHHRGCLQVTGRREVRGRSQAGRDRENNPKRAVGLSGWPGWGFSFYHWDPAPPLQLKLHCCPLKNRIVPMCLVRNDPTNRAAAHYAIKQTGRIRQRIGWVFLWLICLTLRDKSLPRSLKYGHITCKECKPYHNMSINGFWCWKHKNVQINVTHNMYFLFPFHAKSSLTSLSQSWCLPKWDIIVFIIIFHFLLNILCLARRHCCSNATVLPDFSILCVISE